MWWFSECPRNGEYMYYKGGILKFSFLSDLGILIVFMVVRQNSMNLWFNWSWSEKYYLPDKISKNLYTVPVCAIFMGTPLDVFISWNV